MKEYKQVIVLRKDLQMRKGKMCAQAAHASLSTYVKYQGTHKMQVSNWYVQGQRKIVVYVNSEEELVALDAQAQAMDIPHCLITDAGHTEFHGVPTKTCLAIGPDLSSRVDFLTSGLSLL